MNLPTGKDRRRLYDDLAWIWPIISPPEEYIPEGEEFRELIDKHSSIKAKSLLHLGCGGGHLDFTLKRYFQVTGVDTSPAMLELARKLNPEVTYLTGDMRTVRLETAFDAVVIADSIDYMLSMEGLQAAFSTAYLHLKPGGVFCTYAEETVERFRQNKIVSATHTQGDTSITSIDHYFDPDPEDTTYEMTFLYLIRQQGELSVEVDHHLMGLFDQGQWINALEEVGFSVTVVPYEAAGPMYICRKHTV